jgi:hypothetical protein
LTLGDVSCHEDNRSTWCYSVIFSP